MSLYISLHILPSTIFKYKPKLPKDIPEIQIEIYEIRKHYFILYQQGNLNNKKKTLVGTGYTTLLANCMVILKSKVTVWKFKRLKMTDVRRAASIRVPLNYDDFVLTSSTSSLARVNWIFFCSIKCVSFFSVHANGRDHAILTWLPGASKVTARIWYLGLRARKIQ